MTGTLDDRGQRVPVARRVAGIVLLVLSGAGLVLFVLGLWNPWQYVVLLQYFSSPALGLLVVAGLACLGGWLAYPLRDESAQRGRSRFRVFTALGAVAGLLCWGVTGTLFTPSFTVVNQSPDGDRTIAIVDRGRDNRQMHVWSGVGVFARDVGSIGRACGEVTVQFLSRDRVVIGTQYGDWEIDLDPATGAPLQVLGARCADGPEPATLDR